MVLNVYKSSVIIAENTCNIVERLKYLKYHLTHVQVCSSFSQLEPIRIAAQPKYCGLTFAFKNLSLFASTFAKQYIAAATDISHRPANNVIEQQLSLGVSTICGAHTFVGGRNYPSYASSVL